MKVKKPEENKKFSFFDEYRWFIPVLCVVVLFWLLFPWLINVYPLNLLSSEEAGRFGDLFGSFNALFSAVGVLVSLAAFIGFLRALKMQKAELVYQKQAIIQQAEELKVMGKQLALQCAEMKKQNEKLDAQEQMRKRKRILNSVDSAIDFTFKLINNLSALWRWDENSKKTVFLVEGREVRDAAESQSYDAESTLPNPEHPISIFSRGKYEMVTGHAVICYIHRYIDIYLYMLYKRVNVRDMRDATELLSSNLKIVEPVCSYIMGIMNMISNNLDELGRGDESEEIQMLISKFMSSFSKEIVDLLRLYVVAQQEIPEAFKESFSLDNLINYNLKVIIDEKNGVEVHNVDESTVKALIYVLRNKGEEKWSKSTGAWPPVEFVQAAMNVRNGKEEL